MNDLASKTSKVVFKFDPKRYRILPSIDFVPSFKVWFDKAPDFKEHVADGVGSQGSFKDEV